MKDARRMRWRLALVALGLVAAALGAVAFFPRGKGTGGAAWGQAVDRKTAEAPARETGTPRGETERVPVGGEPDILKMPPFVRWRNFGVDDGLPSEKVLCVRADGPRVWAGTEEGLALYENGRFRTWGKKDGLPNDMVLSLDVSPRNGDLWIGTMGGLARMSGGRIQAFTQVSSGLSNDFVHGVKCDPDEDQVWAATAMGASRLDLRTGEWSIFTEQNTPMSEPWTYSVSIEKGLVYVGAWGAGILEYQKSTGRWREYRDPDKEMEIDLLPDDGPVHDVTAGIDYHDGVLWQASYFGFARYDGREWRTYFKEDSGLPSNFVQFVRARGRTAWCSTDDGLGGTDGTSWVTYRRGTDGKGEVVMTRGKATVASFTTDTAMAHSFVLGVDFQGATVWVATEKGLSRGEPDPGFDVAGAAGKAPASASEGAAGGSEIARQGAPAASPPGPLALADRFHYARTPGELLPYRNLKVYHEFFTTPPEFKGAGREKLEPEVDEVRIGFIGPLSDEDHPILPLGFRSGVQGNPRVELYGRPMLRAVQLALDDANRAGGYKGKPFRLVVRTDLVQWGQTSNELQEFAYQDKVWAIVSAVDSNHQHVLARATLKAEVPIVNAGSNDPTLLEHSIPWIVRVMSDDRQNSYLLLDYTFRVRGLRNIALLRVNDRDGRVGIMELVQGARRLNHPILIEQRFTNGDREFSEQLGNISATDADCIVLLGNPMELGRILRALRERGMDLPVFAFSRAVHPAFLEAAGPAAEGVVAAATFNPDEENPLWSDFRSRYRERFGAEPDSFAAHAYDAATLVVAAVRKAGLNRALIRDALFDLKSCPGVSGTMEFDSTINNVRKPWLAEVKGGKFRYFRPPGHGEQGEAAPGNRTAGR